MLYRCVLPVGGNAGISKFECVFYGLVVNFGYVMDHTTGKCRNWFTYIIYVNVVL